MAAKPGWTREGAGYGREHRRLRDELLPFVEAGQVRCARCGERIAPGEPWDLGHVDGSNKTAYQGPEHVSCSRSAGGKLAHGWRSRAAAPPRELERDGIPQNDPCWRVPWLRGLRRPPADAVWPRLMSAPHPSATGSLGAQFCRFAEKRSRHPLRWWQRLVAARLLETDAAGELVWETMLLSLARQLGKSWLLRELLLWRMHQADRFGEPQDVLHTGKDVAVCKEVQRPARIWAKGQPQLFKVREVNGQEEIEFLPDGSRWMLRAKEAVYGYSVSVGAVDEAWKVRPPAVDDGLVPTMVERAQPQLWLISTAHRKATPLMLRRRAAALMHLEDGDGDLLIEWSAPRDVGLSDDAGWRAASPHWTDRRRRLVSAQLQSALSGENDDPDEPDPIESFRAQWLNQWPQHLDDFPAGVSPLLPDGTWQQLAEDGVFSEGGLFVAVEDDYGEGAAVAAAGLLEDGRIEVDGWLRPDWDTAMQDVRTLAEARGLMLLMVGGSLLHRAPLDLLAEPRGLKETRDGLALIRDLAASGAIVHDTTTADLDEAIMLAQVKETPLGLAVVRNGPAHLVKALVWAVHAAHKPAPVAAIY